MPRFKTSEIVNELQTSRSFIYKLIYGKKITVAKDVNGKYIWTQKTIDEIKRILGKKQRNKENDVVALIEELGLRRISIQNRRYLGNKNSLSEFIKKTVRENCKNVNVVTDIFSGTGSVANMFKDKQLITNDLLYSNYISNYAWFAYENYSEKKIVELVYEYNKIKTSENNYMRENFADTFFSADDCSKIGYIREDIERKYKQGLINFKEYAILITSLLYGMDKVANTVGHYDAYRKNIKLEERFKMDVVLPDKNVNQGNKCFNEDANSLIERIKSDLLYLDPPYNSRQYCDAYHILENVACWKKPKVFGVARKMDRSTLKSEYCMSNATQAFKDLVEKADARYILLSYNNMSNKGNGRSNAKIADKDIIEILSKKGTVTIFEEEYKAFSTGKSAIEGNKERLFLCEVAETEENLWKKPIQCPFNYIGGKFKLLDQLTPLFPDTECFLDLFAGGGNVGINSAAKKIIFNDINEPLMDLISYIRRHDIEDFIFEIDELIKEYGLSNSAEFGYEYYGCDSSSGLAKYNRESFLRLRKDYNRQLAQGINNYAMLYTLLVFSFNNQIRFNKRGEFNLPVGKRDYNLRMKGKLRAFANALKAKDVVISKKDFRDISLDGLSPDTFIYCDPPYLITNATYNENGMWTEKDEADLLSFLDKVDRQGLKFALSNVLESKNKTNQILKKWIQERSYKCHYLSKKYSNSNYQRKSKESQSKEILITNY